MLMMSCPFRWGNSKGGKPTILTAFPLGHDAIAIIAKCGAQNNFLLEDECYIDSGLDMWAEHRAVRTYSLKTRTRAGASRPPTLIA